MSNNFIKHKIHLTTTQLSKLRRAFSTKQSVTLRIDPKKAANYELYLTRTQILQLQGGKPRDIKFSKSQLIKQGGLIISLPALIAAGVSGISAISGLAGAASNIAKTVQAKQHQKKMETENKRHNERVEQLLRAQGKGVFLPRKRRGKGVFLPKKKRH